ncbi:MAG: hypothetical protein LBR81_03630 [Prevotellaceae bacterium]|jgi:ABC-type phosphate transport system auxiliary subunit|nr:hypothetical protein [Prevotellaceae bacterium]
MEKDNNELDLIDLLKLSVNFAKKALIWCLGVVLWIVRFHVKHIVLIGLFILLGIALFTYRYMPAHRNLNADFVMKINTETSYEVYDIVGDLRQTIDREQNSQLAKILNLPPAVAAKVKDIQPCFVIDRHNNNTRDFIDYAGSFKEDSLDSRMKNFLAVRIWVKSGTDFTALQNSIVNYLKKNSYLEKKNVEKKIKLQERIKIVDKEIASLYDLRQQEVRGNDRTSYLAMENNRFSINDQSSYSYHQDLMNLNNNKINYESQLKEEIVSIHSGVVISEHYTLKYLLTRSIIPFYLLGLFLALIVQFRRTIIKTIKE